MFAAAAAVAGAVARPFGGAYASAVTVARLRHGVPTDQVERAQAHLDAGVVATLAQGDQKALGEALRQAADDARGLERLLACFPAEEAQRARAQASDALTLELAAQQAHMTWQDRHDSSPLQGEESKAHQMAYQALLRARSAREALEVPGSVHLVATLAARARAAVGTLTAKLAEGAPGGDTVSGETRTQVDHVAQPTTADLLALGAAGAAGRGGDGQPVLPEGEPEGTRALGKRASPAPPPQGQRKTRKVDYMAALDAGSKPAQPAELGPALFQRWVTTGVKLDGFEQRTVLGAGMALVKELAKTTQFSTFSAAETSLAMAVQALEQAACAAGDIPGLQAVAEFDRLGKAFVRAAPYACGGKKSEKDRMQEWVLTHIQRDSRDAGQRELARRQLAEWATAAECAARGVAFQPTVTGVRGGAAATNPRTDGATPPDPQAAPVAGGGPPPSTPAAKGRTGPIPRPLLLLTQQGGQLAGIAGGAIRPQWTGCLGCGAADHHWSACPTTVDQLNRKGIAFSKEPPRTGGRQG